jgi:hypothetical protein
MRSYKLHHEGKRAKTAQPQPRSLEEDARHATHAVTAEKK